MSSFPVRLALTFALTLGVVGVVQYALVSHDVETRLNEASIERNESAARQLQEAYLGVDEGESPLGEAQEAIVAIAREPGVDNVELMDKSGMVLAASEPFSVGHRENSAAIQAAIRSGESQMGADDSKAVSDSPVEFVVPVDVPVGRLALEIDEDGEALRAEMAGLRLQLLESMLIGLALGFPLLWALGGASLSRRHRRAVERSGLDPLTQLGNQQEFQRAIARAVAHARRSGEALSVAVLDVDRFKGENDAHGHQHGDRVLRGLAELLREGRESDSAFRIGGDEFVLLMPDTGLDGALLAGERLRAGATRMEEPVTLSIGVAQLAPGAEPMEFVRAADDALYEAKGGGRNAVEAAPLSGGAASVRAA